MSTELKCRFAQLRVSLERGVVTATLRRDQTVSVSAQRDPQDAERWILSSRGRSIGDLKRIDAQTVTELGLRPHLGPLVAALTETTARVEAAEEVRESTGLPPPLDDAPSKRWEYAEMSDADGVDPSVIAAVGMDGWRVVDVWRDQTSGVIKKVLVERELS